MNAHRKHTDGDLPSAKRRLEDAVTELTEPRSDGHGHHSVSLYLQLADALEGEQGGGWNGAPQSQPCMWIDAADLLREIDLAVECWHPQLAGVPATVGRLRSLQARGWKPQQTRNVLQIAEACEDWAKQIVALLDPGCTKHFRAPNGDGYAPCPQCGRSTTYRLDPSDGESKRVPVLQWTAEAGTQCLVCKAHWEPNKTLWVSQLLGFELPVGVLSIGTGEPE